MQGLAVVDGDLVLSGSNFLLIDGPAKIKQDLSFAINEAYGSDIFHPYWGSILDQFIGQPMTAAVEKQVSDEVQRILNNYISVQTDQVNSAITSGSLSTYDTSDVVQTVQDISVQVQMDRIIIAVTLATLSGDSVTLARTVTI